MMEMNKLAIVIPIYKPTFLREALNSLSRQTCKKFNLYLSNDASPYDIKSIVSEFVDIIPFVYHEFEFNLGGINLVNHWSRSIDLIQDEDWIWLLSDDDLIDINCVEKFYVSTDSFPKFDVYHFNVKMIDSKGEIIRIFKPFDSIMGSFDFFNERSKNNIASFVVEYIFSKKIYKSFGGFVDFDLAWGADHASWIKFSSLNGIYTIDGAFVYWRKSEYNISPNCIDMDICLRKINASSDYYLWVFDFFEKKNISSFVFLRYFVNDCRAYNSIVSFIDFKICTFNFIDKLFKNYSSISIILIKVVMVCFLLVHRFFKSIK